MNARRPRLTQREQVGTGVHPDEFSTPVRPLPATLAIFFIGLFLVLASWLFGGVQLWSRQVLFLVALIPFLLALVPIPRKSLRDSAWSHTRTGLRRLITFPPFWLGLFIFGYVWLQSINPSYEYVMWEGKWYLTIDGLDPDPDWPTSIDAPADKGNPASFLLRFGAVWMIICAARVFVRGKKDLLAILIAVSVNSFVIAMVAIIQEMRPPEKVLWIMPWAGSDFAGPFFYRNHGGAFFYLAMAVSFGLALHFQRARDTRHEKSSPGPIFVLFGLMNAGAVAASGSRAGWIFGTAVLVTYTILSLSVWLRRKQWNGNWMGGLIVSSCLIVVAGTVTLSQNLEQLERHFNRFLNLPAELELSVRTIGNQASMAMLQDVPIFGYGADSYGHAFALYYDQFPQLIRKNRQSEIVRNHWVQAHNDPLQYAVELGLVGASALAMILLYYLGAFLWRILYFREETLLWFAGAVYLFIHSFADLVFQSVPILALFAFLLLTVERFLLFEKRKKRPGI